MTVSYSFERYAEIGKPTMFPDVDPDHLVPQEVWL